MAGNEGPGARGGQDTGVRLKTAAAAAAAEAPVDRCVAFVLGRFPGSRVDERHGNFVRFEVTWCCGRALSPSQCARIVLFSKSFSLMCELNFRGAALSLGPLSAPLGVFPGCRGEQSRA